METKLFIISIILFIYTFLLKSFFRKERINKISVIVFHMFFCGITGAVIGMVLSTFTNRPELMTRFIGVGIFAGVIFALLQLIGKDNEKQIKILKIDLDWSDTSWSAILLASILMYFVIQAFKIPSGSMRMTLIEGDHLFVNKFIYGFHVPFSGGKRVLPIKKVKRQDIIIFECPPEALSPAERERKIKKDFIKRAIGLPGDTVEIINKKVYVNGELLNEPYTNFEDKDYIQPKIKLFNTQEEYQSSWEQGRFVNLPVRDNFGPIKVPKDCYFVLGDNRDRSFDSRFWGPVPDRNLKGQSLIIYWPVTRIRIIK